MIGASRRPSLPFERQLHRYARLGYRALRALHPRASVAQHRPGRREISDNVRTSGEGGRAYLVTKELPMAVLFQDLVAMLRADPNKNAGVRLSIQDTHAGNWVANGDLEYREEEMHKVVDDVLYKGPSSFGIKALNNATFNETMRGSWGEYQSFLVEDPAPEMWDVKIFRSGLQRHPGPGLPYEDALPELYLATPSRPHLGTISVQLRAEANGMYSGVGQSPIDQNKSAVYVLSLDVAFKIG